MSGKRPGMVEAQMIMKLLSISLKKISGAQTFTVVGSLAITGMNSCCDQ